MKISRFKKKKTLSNIIQPSNSGFTKLDMTVLIEPSNAWYANHQKMISAMKHPLPDKLT